MFTDNIIAPCDPCYAFTLAECTEATQIQVIGSLADGDYEWFVQDRFGNVYTGQSTAAGGNINILIAGFPDKLFNQYSGSFTIWFEQSGEVKPTTFSTVEYNCIKINFTAVSPAPATLVIS